MASVRRTRLFGVGRACHVASGVRPTCAAPLAERRRPASEPVLVYEGGGGAAVTQTRRLVAGSLAQRKAAFLKVESRLRSRPRRRAHLALGTRCDGRPGGCRHAARLLRRRAR